MNQDKHLKKGKTIIDDLQNNLEKELIERKDRLYDADNKNNILLESLEKAMHELSMINKWHR